MAVMHYLYQKQPIKWIEQKKYNLNTKEIRLAYEKEYIQEKYERHKGNSKK